MDARYTIPASATHIADIPKEDLHLYNFIRVEQKYNKNTTYLRIPLKLGLVPYYYDNDGHKKQYRSYVNKYDFKDVILPPSSKEYELLTTDSYIIVLKSGLSTEGVKWCTYKKRAYICKEFYAKCVVEFPYQVEEVTLNNSIFLNGYTRNTYELLDANIPNIGQIFKGSSLNPEIYYTNPTKGVEVVISKLNKITRNLDCNHELLSLQHYMRERKPFFWNQGKIYIPTMNVMYFDSLIEFYKNQYSNKVQQMNNIRESFKQLNEEGLNKYKLALHLPVGTPVKFVTPEQKVKREGIIVAHKIWEGEDLLDAQAVIRTEDGREWYRFRDQYKNNQPKLF